MTDANPRTSALSPQTVDWTRVTKVLLIRLRSIGDTVLMTPCLGALNDWRPDIRVSVVIEPLAAPILEGHSLVDQLFLIDKTIASKRVALSALRRERFDLAFNLHGGTTGMLLAAMCGARRSFAYQQQRGSWMLTDCAPGPDVILKRDQIHSVEQQLALLNWAGVPMPARPTLHLNRSADAEATVKQKLVSAGVTNAELMTSRFAIVAPGAAFESKRWRIKKFSSVIEHIANKWQLESIVIAGPGQDNLARAVADSSATRSYLLSEISLAELKALIGSFGRIFIGNDSGPMHIAAAFGCPIVAVFGSSNPGVWHPWTSTPYRVLGGARGQADNDTRDAIDRVQIDEAISAVDQVLEWAVSRTAS